MKPTNELIAEALDHTGEENQMAEAIFDFLKKEEQQTIGECVNLILTNIPDKEARVRMAVLVSVQILEAQDAEMSVMKQLRDMMKGMGMSTKENKPEITILPSDPSIAGWIQMTEEDGIVKELIRLINNDKPETFAQIVERLEGILTESKMLYLIIVLFTHSKTSEK